jgi:acyl-lipid omega-6 desaturase (Delta-12 desaturase)
MRSGLSALMDISSVAERVALPAKDWPKILRAYREPSRARSLAELAVTIVPFALLWALTCVAFRFGGWWGLLLTIPTAGFLLRLFMIQHDCGHGSFLAHRRSDDWIGRAIGVLTLTPYDYWRKAHAEHHATAGNLDERGVGDILTMTVDEYRALGWSGRLGYRLYRNPFVMFVIGPIWVFGLKQRVPVGMMREGALPWLSTMLTNLAIVAASALLIWLVGIWAFLAVHLPVVLIAGTAGIWLFFVQHQFEETTWEREANWDFSEAALHGASNYVLPKPLAWLTGNIGVHHVHHLASRVPHYRLPEILRNHPELAEIGRIGILDSLRCVKYVLWDEASSRLVSFRQARVAV